jgi:hypothetical protein
MEVKRGELWQGSSGRSLERRKQNESCHRTGTHAKAPCLIDRVSDFNHAPDRLRDKRNLPGQLKANKTGKTNLASMI